MRRKSPNLESNALRRPISLVKPSCRAVTLLELLMVVAIIALLLAILLPSLSKVREQSRTVLCSSNMRQMAHLVIEFGADHDGRGPNGGNVGKGAMINRITNASTSAGDPYAAIQQPDSSGIGWSQELDTWVLGRSSGSYGIALNQSSNPTVAIKTLTCPNDVNPGGHLSFAYNDDARGGTNFTTGDTPVTYYPSCGVYGLVAPPPTNFKLYWLGAKLAQFSSNQIMLLEHERAADTVMYHSWHTQADGSVPDPPNSFGMGMGDDMGPPDNYPAYSGYGGDYSFRHPYYKAGVGKANFVFFDAHIELLRPKDEMNTARRLSLGGGL